MENFIIKSYNVNHICEASKFYILCKGLNSGKPLSEPCPNCFIVICTSEEQKQQLYWICFCFWKLKRFQPHLIGSVIPFLRIKDFRNMLQNYLLSVSNKKSDKIKYLTKNLNDIKLLEERLIKKLTLIQEMKNSVLKEYLSA